MNGRALLLVAALAVLAHVEAQTPAARPAKQFDTPQLAADALIKAAGTFDVDGLRAIFGPEGDDIFLTDEYPRDRQRALDFVAKAREKKVVTVDQDGTRAFLAVGNDGWPFPVPLVKAEGGWQFDAGAGREELLNRRIGANELDAIAVCRGYVEAQYAYAFQKRERYEAPQYAQRVIGKPDKRDGLAWQDADGTWSGPVGEKIARAIAQGYRSGAEPYHGYFFKILKGQGPKAPHGRTDYVVNGVMIGGFALAAAPAQYGKTGVMTFIVSHAGIVYEKDIGPDSLDAFRKLQLFDPDSSWTPVAEKKGR